MADSHSNNLPVSNRRSPFATVSARQELPPYFPCPIFRSKLALNFCAINYGLILRRRRKVKPMLMFKLWLRFKQPDSVGRTWELDGCRDRKSSGNWHSSSLLEESRLSGLLRQWQSGDKVQVLPFARGVV